MKIDKNEAEDKKYMFFISLLNSCLNFNGFKYVSFNVLIAKRKKEADNVSCETYPFGKDELV